MHNSLTELQMQFSWTKEEIKDFNNFIGFRKCFFTHQLSPSGNQGTKQYNHLSMCGQERAFESDFLSVNNIIYYHLCVFEQDIQHSWA